jgi:hypothetical protein
MAEVDMDKVREYAAAKGLRIDLDGNVEDHVIADFQELYPEPEPEPQAEAPEPEPAPAE